jgi:hypothetical protein
MSKQLTSFRLRLACAVNVLRGRPTMYRMGVEGGLRPAPGTSHSMVAECVLYMMPTTDPGAEDKKC